MRTFQRIARLIRPAIGLPVLAGLAIFGLMVMALGCNEDTGRAATAAPAVNPRLPDVPVPAGFSFDADRSKERMARGFRFVEHHYKGKATVRQVAGFYRDIMPRAGWKPLEENLVSGRQRLLFEKGNDTCHVSIWDDWGTRLLIQVLPSGGRPAVNPAAPSTEPMPNPAARGLSTGS
jgi:hypothetical protein